MVDEFLVKSLKRIFDECQDAQNKDATRNVGATLVSEFNDLLKKYKDEFSDDDVIQSIESVECTGTVGSVHPQDVQQVKLECLKIADILNLSTNDFREPAASNGITTIHLEANQNVNQSVSIQNIIDMVNMQMMPDNEKKKLRDVIEEFGDEIEKEEPNKSKLKGLLDTAREYKPDIALQLGALALSQGVDVLLGTV